MNNILEITIYNEPDKDRMTVVTEDSEYGKIMWRLVNGQLTCVALWDLSDKQAKNPPAELWEPFAWNQEPPGGDAAIHLENSTALLVTAIFGLRDLVRLP